MQVMVTIYTAAILVNSVRFFEYQVFQLPVSKSVLRIVVKTTTCCFDMVPPFSDNIHLYFNLYFWCRIILVNIIPCVSLTVLIIRLVYAMHEVQLKRSQHVRQLRMTEFWRLGEVKATTLTSLIFVSVFLVVHLPRGINLMIHIMESNSEPSHFNRWAMSPFEVVINLLTVFISALNFLINCATNRQFRNTFRTMISAWCPRYQSSSTHANQCLGSTAAGSATLRPTSTAVQDEVVVGIVASRTHVVIASIEAGLAVEDDGQMQHLRMTPEQLELR